MTEKEYRINCLEQRIVSYRDKRIALYGVGVNAKIILEQFSDMNILALLDEKHEGEYYYGKKVISLQEAVILDVEVIIIAAQISSACLISDRIREFCVVNHIILLNMYGLDEIQLRRNVLNQELTYAQCTESLLRRQVQAHDIICVQLMDVLCAHGHPCRGETFTAEEWNDLIPKPKMVEIINWAMGLKKKVYLVSDLPLCEYSNCELNQILGIVQCLDDGEENLMYIINDSRAIGRVALENSYSSMLYIGTNRQYDLIVPQLYGMDIFLLKSAEDIFYQFSTLAREGKIIPDGEGTNDLYHLIQHSYMSPFICQYDEVRQGEKLLLPLNLFEKPGDWTNYKPKLWALPTYKHIDELEKIVFPECEKPIVSIIIPVYNQFAYTYNCLKAIREHTGDISYEVIIADDGSDDDMIHLERVVSGAIILRNSKNLLFLLNCNHAASYANGKYLLFLNNDTQVQPGWLQPLVQLMEADASIGMVGSQLLFPDGSIQEAGGILWENGCACNYGRGCGSGAPEYNYIREVDYISGASIMVRTDLWKEIGGFDERYIPAYCEDSDFAFEVRRHGKRVVYQPASKVVHFEGVSNGTDVTKGIKGSQLLNMKKFREKWQEVLNTENHVYGQKDLSVCDRKGDRKLVLVIGANVSKENNDDISKSILQQMGCLVDQGYIVKLIPVNFCASEDATAQLQQMGIEVLMGEYYRNNIVKWILDNQNDIDYACVIGTKCKEKYQGLLSCTSIRQFFSKTVEDAVKAFGES